MLKDHSAALLLAQRFHLRSRTQMPQIQLPTLPKFFQRKVDDVIKVNKQHYWLNIGKHQLDNADQTPQVLASNELYLKNGQHVAQINFGVFSDSLSLSLLCSNPTNAAAGGSIAGIGVGAIKAGRSISSGLVESSKGGSIL